MSQSPYRGQKDSSFNHRQQVTSQVERLADVLGITPYPTNNDDIQQEIAENNRRKTPDIDRPHH